MTLTELDYEIIEVLRNDIHESIREEMVDLYLKYRDMGYTEPTAGFLASFHCHTVMGIENELKQFEKDLKDAPGIENARNN